MIGLRARRRFFEPRRSQVASALHASVSGRALVGCAAVMGVLVFPAGALAAAVTIGSQLTATPTGATTVGVANCLSTCTIVDFHVPPGIAPTSPIDGVVVRWRVIGGGNLRLRVLNHSGTGAGAYVGAGTQSFSLPTSTAVQTMPACLPIHIGDYVGVDVFDATGSVSHGQPGAGAVTDWLVPAVPDGQHAAGININGGREHLFNADVQASSCISSIAPASGPSSGGTSVVITGNGFTGATAVKFGTTAAASFTVNSATQITAVSPPGSPGAADITVTTPTGMSPTGPADTFTWVASSPTASITTPANGSSYTQNQVVASSFSCTDSAGGPGISTCLDQNNHASGAAIDTSTVGPHTLTVTATSKDGLTGTASVTYNVAAVTPSVVVTRVTPNRGFAFSLVLISGKGFNNVHAVDFGAGHAALFVRLSSTLILALVPPHAPGTVDVTVQAAAGTSAVSSADRFTYRAPRRRGPRG